MWCDFPNISWHNTDECHSKQEFLADPNENEIEFGFDFNSNQGKGKRIINAKHVLPS